VLSSVLTTSMVVKRTTNRAPTVGRELPPQFPPQRGGRKATDTIGQ